MKKREMHDFKLNVLDEDGSVVDNLEFTASENFIVEVFWKTPSFPERSPLHEKALNMADLKVGMNIRRHNVKHGSGTQDTALVNGKPFRRGTKSHKHRETQGDAHWMIPVVTINYAGRLVHEDWFLSDMGVVPYEHADGSHWNSANYTLAVD